MSMWRAWKSYSPAIARRFSTSRFSASVKVTLSMYGSWLPSVSTQTEYGLRSYVQVGDVIGVTSFHGVTTGSSGLRAASFNHFMWRTQLSYLASLAFWVALSAPMYLGWNFLR